ncbi:MAG: CapA family protein [Oscillospiraceae bacterium]|nr:CapA family protein [Oscillospiraceae bacterium]
MKKFILLTTAFLLLLCSCGNINGDNGQNGGNPAVLTTEETTAAPEIQYAKLQFAGDVLLHTKPVAAAKLSGGAYDFTPYFQYISPYVDGDLAICNIETPIDSYGGNTKMSSYPMFNAPFEILDAVKGMGFNMFINANNHLLDQGWTGLVKTKENFEAVGVVSDGTYRTPEEREKHTVIDVNGIKIGVIPYTDSLNGLDGVISTEKLQYAVRKFASGNPDSIPSMLDDIAGCRDAGAEFIIVALHWGAEYGDRPTAMQKEIARALCEGGADIIMGSHSHSMHPVEWIDSPDGRRSLCMYSLGNFFADQYDISPPTPKTQYAALVSAYIVRDIENGRPYIHFAEYLPTFTYRHTGAGTPNGYGYALLPAGKASMGILKTEADKTRTVTAFEHVVKIVGDGISVVLV